MIIVDMSQVLIANLFSQQSYQGEITEDQMRHQVLNSIRSYKSKFGLKYGELVLCFDAPGENWRKNFFPFYKAKRKDVRDKQKIIDWPEVYRIFDVLFRELEDWFPYRCIRIEGVEADDIIGTIIIRGLTQDKNNLIISNDKDFKQLQIPPSDVINKHGIVVEQYTPIQSKYVTCDDYRDFLKEHIISGDRSDGIPNVLSDDDTFVSTSKRQKPLRTSKLESMMKMDFDSCDNETLRYRFNTNKKLISLFEIPDEIVNKIVDEFNKSKDKNKFGRKSLMKYFIEHKLKHLLSYIGDF